MAKDGSNLHTHIRDLRANFVKRYLSLSFNESHKPNLDYDIDALHQMEQQDDVNGNVWGNFINYFENIDMNKESYDNHDTYKKIIDYLKEAEDGKHISKETISSLISPLINVLSDEITIDPAKTSNDVDINVETSITTEFNNLYAIDFDQLSDPTPLKHILLSIDSDPSQESTIFDHLDTIKQFIDELQPLNLNNIYQYFNEKIENKDSTTIHNLVIKLLDLYQTLELRLPIDISLDFESLYPKLFLFRAYDSYYNALSSIYKNASNNPKVLERRSTKRELSALYSVIQTNALYTLDQTLIDKVSYIDIDDKTANLTLIDKILQAINHQNELILVGKVHLADTEEKSTKATSTTDEATPSITAGDSISEIVEINQSIHHPYYLSGYLETALREAPDYDEDLLAELKESYQEEVNDEVFPTIVDSLKILEQKPYDKNQILELRRAFHTLKGSGYMAGYMTEGEIAWQVEQVLNGCRDGHFDFNPAIWHHANDGYQAIQSLLHSESIAENELERIAYQANYLLNNHGIIEPTETEFVDIPTTPESKDNQGSITSTSPYHLNGFLEVELKDAPDYDADLLAELKESYQEEVNDEVFPTIISSLDTLKNEPYDNEVILELRRAFHTLKGSGYMAGYMLEGEIAWQAEQVLNGCRDGHYNFNPAIWNHANEAYVAVKQMLSGESTPDNELERIAYQANYLLENRGIIEAQDFTTSNITVENHADDLSHKPVLETPDELSANEDHLALDSVDDNEKTSIPPIKDPITTIQYDLTGLQELYHQLTDLYERLSDGSYYDLRDFARLCGQLTDQSPMPSSLKEQQLIEALQFSALMHRAHGISPRKDMLSLWNSVLAVIQKIINQNENIDTEQLNQYISELKKPIISYPTKETKPITSEADDELYQLFSTEAIEILEITDELINDWKDDGYRADSELIAEFRRHMHTLKGSARMVGKNDVGQLAHAMESLLDPLYISRFNSDPKQFDLLQRTLDHIPLMLEYKESRLGEEGYNLLSALHLLLGNETPPELDDQGNVEGDQTHTDVTEKTSTAAQAELSAIRVSPISLANISEDIAENIILDTQQNRNLTQINNTIDELERTISRVNTQTRRIEIEMEAQMLSRHARLIEDEDFDPLELDRFTELQQITRFISESVADLNSLCENIQEQTEELDINLEKQKTLHDYINHSLNEIRTVSFLSVVPRLRRLIRQVSKEHHKKVELIAKGIEIQAERSIVEQMVPPLEHMIRNSIIHGLENTERRDQVDKAATGKITLEIIKEEAELLIRFSDDGQGIDINKVRNRVIQMGEISKDDNLTDQEIVNMLMLPGMSTAGGVSQDAGRGVGLDVLAKATLLLNADISIINRPNKGLTFEIRIPFALSTINALIVKSGAKFYALPLNHIISVERQDNRDDDNNIVYQGRKFKIYNLTKVYRDVSIFSQESDQFTYLLIEIDNECYALEIDEIITHQEMIMRPLNPQIARTPGLTGVSILSGGEIVYIIDVSKLFSSILIEQESGGIDIDRLSTEFLEEATKDQTPKVLIVDDSITMRRVSSRLVERLGLTHETAKDGLDAIEKIEKEIPDLIMLDIEMPNMDGFEVLNYLRTDENFSQIPIIMITSRIGEKHKERALELGADMYCGKPYSEEEMTKNIKELLGKKWDNIHL